MATAAEKAAAEKAAEEKAAAEKAAKKTPENADLQLCNLLHRGMSMKEARAKLGIK